MEEKIRYRLCWNYGGKVNKEGRAPVAVELRQGQAKMYLSSGVMLYPEQWQAGRIVKHENGDKLTAYLHRWMHRIEEIELDALLRGNRLSLHQLKTAYKEGVHRSATIEDFTQSVVAASARGKQTRNAYKTMTAAVNAYCPGARLTDITHDWIERWRKKMRDDELSENTIKGRLKQLRCIVNEAIARRLINRDDDPFQFVTIGNMTAKVAWLTMSELQRIERLELVGREAVVKDLFLFAAYTGLRWSDLVTLEEATIRKGVLRKVMVKTGHEVIIPIGTLFWGKAQNILNHYPDIRKLSHGVKCNSTANRIIKEIVAKAGIKKSVSFHVARKSTASNLSLLGMPLQEITTVLGHTKAEVTIRHYLFSQEQSLKKASKRIFKKTKEE